MKIQWKKLIICLIVPLAVGGLSALLTGNAMQSFNNVAKPPLSPPGWLFPVVWTVLYLLMGYASYLVVREQKPTDTSLAVYGLQLFFNFCWSIIFFRFESYLFAFVWLVLLWLLILAAILLFRRTSKTAAYLLIPYLLWVSFAGYLNFGI
ncbi:MAG: tryptophan-rich sensory protein, partial [Clostridia bacterium]|nr:tryptophan-rich sensory protein [Clostridia bacterium]